MPIPNLPPRDAITGRFLESTVKDTAKNLNTPAKVTKNTPELLPPVRPPKNRVASLGPPTPPVKQRILTPPVVNRNAPARPPVTKTPQKKGR